MNWLGVLLDVLRLSLLVLLQYLKQRQAARQAAKIQRAKDNPSAAVHNYFGGVSESTSSDMPSSAATDKPDGLTSGNNHKNP